MYVTAFVYKVTNIQIVRTEDEIGYEYSDSED